jgi:hypothetical protein
MDDAIGRSKINPLQNGLLLRSDIHQLFDQYPISANPDVGLTGVTLVLQWGLIPRMGKTRR